jgi:ADP-ribose pyrophosphatase YjhB (NUDIX family)
VQLSIALRRIVLRGGYTVLRGYWFLARPRLTGVKCVLTDGDLVLLVRHTYGPREWEIPGGGIKRHEPPARAARREMREELGVQIEDWIALGELAVTMNRRTGTLHCFHAIVRAAGLEPDRGEIADARWFSHHDLPPDRGPYVVPIVARLQAQW